MNKNRKRIVWLSSNVFGYELLKEAIKICPDSIIAIITLDETAKTRMYDGVSTKIWEKFNIPIYKVTNINIYQKLIKKLNPDLIFMCGWRQILSSEVLSIPKKGVIAFHPSLLPKGRGPAPIINSILEGYTRSGVTMFFASDGVDNGDIIGQKQFFIRDNDYAMDVYRKVIKAGKELIKAYLPLILNDCAPRKSQKNDEVTYFPHRTVKDNEILSTDLPEIIHRKVRAFSSPYMGAFVRIGEYRLIIKEAKIEKK